MQSNTERNYKFTFKNKFLAVKQQRHPYFYIVFNIPFAVKRNKEFISRPHFKGITILHRVIPSPLF